MRVSFKVTLEIPTGATVTQTKSLIETSVKAAPGYLSKDDPLFNLARHTVKVSVIATKR